MKNNWQKKTSKAFEGKSSILITAAIIIVGGVLLKILADNQSRVDY